MLLAVDVGNTNTVIGVCEGGQVRDTGTEADKQ